MNSAKIKYIIALQSQYSIPFSGRHDEVVYILVSLKLRVVKDMYTDHYVCDLLGYNTGIWWRWDNDTITNYSGHPENIYDDLSH